MKKLPCAQRPGRLRALASRDPSPAALGAAATGSEGSLLAVSMKPGGLRQTTWRCSRGEWVVRWSNHGSLIPRAQCNQGRKFCQEGNSLGSTKSCCRVFKLSIPSGRVPSNHKGERPWRARKYPKNRSRGPVQTSRVAILISEVRVRWTGHLLAISSSLDRCSPVNDPLK